MGFLDTFNLLSVLFLTVHPDLDQSLLFLLSFLNLDLFFGFEGLHLNLSFLKKCLFGGHLRLQFGHFRFLVSHFLLQEIEELLRHAKVVR